MDVKQIEKKTLDDFEAGFSCAEVILKNILENFAPQMPADIPKAASGFVAGLGRTKSDICGTVAGGVMALGYLHGRVQPGADITPLCDLVAAYRARFMERFGATNCAEILKNFGKQEKMNKCKQMTAEAAGMLAALIAENPAR